MSKSNGGNRGPRLDDEDRKMERTADAAARQLEEEPIDAEFRDLIPDESPGTATPAQEVPPDIPYESQSEPDEGEDVFGGPLGQKLAAAFDAAGKPIEAVVEIVEEKFGITLPVHPEHKTEPTHDPGSEVQSSAQPTTPPRQSKPPRAPAPRQSHVRQPPGRRQEGPPEKPTTCLIKGCGFTHPASDVAEWARHDNECHPFKRPDHNAGSTASVKGQAKGTRSQNAPTEAVEALIKGNTRPELVQIAHDLKVDELTVLVPMNKRPLAEKIVAKRGETTGDRTRTEQSQAKTQEGENKVAQDPVQQLQDQIQQLQGQINQLIGQQTPAQPDPQTQTAIQALTQQVANLTTQVTEAKQAAQQAPKPAQQTGGTMDVPAGYTKCPGGCDAIIKNENLGKHIMREHPEMLGGQPAGSGSPANQGSQVPPGYTLCPQSNCGAMVKTENLGKHLMAEHPESLGIKPESKEKPKEASKDEHESEESGNPLQWILEGMGLNFGGKKKSSGH
jgi:hypothetical protein